MRDSKSLLTVVNKLTLFHEKLQLTQHSQSTQSNNKPLLEVNSACCLRRARARLRIRAAGHLSTLHRAPRHAVTDVTLIDKNHRPSGVHVILSALYPLLFQANSHFFLQTGIQIIVYWTFEVVRADLRACPYLPANSMHPA
jgi:hypothetical protein